jgi:hypothetical protein
MNLIIRNLVFRASNSKSGEYVIHKGKYLLPKQPTRPQSAYIIYINEKRPEFKDLKMTESSQVIGKMWKELAEEQKKKYE